MSTVVDPSRARVLFSADLIATAVRDLGERISSYYGDGEVYMVALLGSSLFFAADLCREIKSPVEIDFLCISGYGSSEEDGGEVSVVKDVQGDLRHRNVLLVDVVAESGLTLDFAMRHVMSMGPASLRTCVLLDCADMRLADVSVDFSGLVCPSAPFAGYGLDLNGRLRHLPYICDASDLA